MSDDADDGGFFSLGEKAGNDERSTMQKMIGDLSAQRATAAKVLEWLEADSSFEAIYGSDSKERYVAGERERISGLDMQIARYQRSLEGWQLVDTTELGLLELRGLQKSELAPPRRCGALSAQDVSNTLKLE